MNKANVKDTDTGRVVEGEGWFVLNLAEASWERHPDAGVWCSLEAEDAPFAQFGANVHIVMPVRPTAAITPRATRKASSSLPGSASP